MLLNNIKGGGHIMYCRNCGNQLADTARFCGGCGTPVEEKRKIEYTEDIENIQDKKSIQERANVISYGSAGFSTKISDPAFAKYLKNTNKWSAIFSIILAMAAIIGFFIYGETSSEMDNPQAMYIGLGIGGMFILIALFQILGRNRSKTWDGTVIDKTIKNKRRRQNTGSDTNDYYWVDYIEYKVIIRSDSGKKHEITAEDDTTVYNYYEKGDRVRHHGGLNSYEKYDKSKDSIIFCAACGSLNNIEDDNCFRCKCPLLK